MERVYNFNAGPSVLPVPVLERARDEMLNWHGSGMSVMEMSHRGKDFESILGQTEADLRDLLRISDNYHVLFLQGGAHLQFSMIPMNFINDGASVDYIVTGTWGRAAFKEAAKLRSARIAYTSEGTNFDRVPDKSDVGLDSDASYLHFTSNETIHGVQFSAEPETVNGVPLVCDASSDFLSRPVDVGKYALIYAGAQKNMGPSGVTVGIVRGDLLDRVPGGLPLMLDYRLMAEKKSLFNTPPCFNIYMVGLVMQWLKGTGGLEAVAKHNQAKAAVIYGVIDESGGYYCGHTRREDRSLMNITFRLPSEGLEKQFVQESQEKGFVGLKGHRSVGGLRASLYNAQTVEAAEKLADFMGDFQRRNG